jgi:hypothetical protein
MFHLRDPSPPGSGARPLGAASSSVTRVTALKPHSTSRVKSNCTQASTIFPSSSDICCNIDRSKGRRYARRCRLDSTVPRACAPLPVRSPARARHAATTRPFRGDRRARIGPTHQVRRTSPHEPPWVEQRKGPSNDRKFATRHAPELERSGRQANQERARPRGHHRRVRATRGPSLGRPATAPLAAIAASALAQRGRHRAADGDQRAPS